MKGLVRTFHLVAVKTLEKLKQKIDKILLFKVITLACVSDRFGKGGRREMN